MIKHDIAVISFFITVQFDRLCGIVYFLAYIVILNMVINIKRYGLKRMFF